MTRGFAHGLQREQAVMVTAVEVAEDISSLLARYETDEAAELVEGAAGTALPSALCEALRQLLPRLGFFNPIRVQLKTN